MGRGKRKARSDLPSDGDEEHPADSLILKKAAARASVEPAAEQKQCDESLQPQAAKLGQRNVAREGTEAAEPPALAAPTGVTVIDDDDDAAGAQSRVQRLLRGSRYFDEHFEAGIRCYRCGGTGHTARDCTQPEKPRPCTLCAQYGHQRNNCPNALCFKCKRPGHMAKDCTNGRLEAEEAVCLRCGRKDCDSAGQPDYVRAEGGCHQQYSKRDLKRVRCCSCARMGHLCCEPVLAPDTVKLSCYNCGQGGHVGEECHKSLQGRALNERLFDMGANTGRQSWPQYAAGVNRLASRTSQQTFSPPRSRSTGRRDERDHVSYDDLYSSNSYSAPQKQYTGQYRNGYHDQHMRFHDDDSYQDPDAAEAHYDSRQQRAYGYGPRQQGYGMQSAAQQRYGYAGGHDDRYHNNRY